MNKTKYKQEERKRETLWYKLYTLNQISGYTLYIYTYTLTYTSTYYL